MTRGLRFVIRTLIHGPAFTMVAVVTLALGIAANTAIFSAVEAVLLQLPFPQACGDPLGLLPLVRGQVAALDRNLPVSRIATKDQLMDSLVRTHFSMNATGGICGVGAAAGGDRNSTFISGAKGCACGSDSRTEI